MSDKLARWHGDPMRKALLVTGARQVGKTFAIREFIRSTYESSLEINSSGSIEFVGRTLLR
ncbi:MAG: AAA family ATPase [Eggerthellaceae bacterium]|nr:AAA family ATPase [Eggerthellaceae bacterium]